MQLKTNNVEMEFLFRFFKKGGIKIQSSLQIEETETEAAICDLSCFPLFPLAGTVV